MPVGRQLPGAALDEVRRQDITHKYLAAGSVRVILPVIVIFVVLQRQTVGALTAGAVKG